MLKTTKFSNKDIILFQRRQNWCWPSGIKLVRDQAFLSNTDGSNSNTCDLPLTPQISKEESWLNPGLLQFSAYCCSSKHTFFFCSTSILFEILYFGLKKKKILFIYWMKESFPLFYLWTDDRQSLFLSPPIWRSAQGIAIWEEGSIENHLFPIIRREGRQNDVHWGVILCQFL